MSDPYSRVVTTLRGEKPDRLPFISRLEMWYSCHSRAGTLPEEFKQRPEGETTSVMSLFTVPIPRGLSVLPLTEIHRRIGMGQQFQRVSHARRFRGVELSMRLNGEEFHHELDPVVEFFPRLFDHMLPDKPGETVAEFATPRGRLTTRTSLTPEAIAQGAVPVMNEHPVKSVEDYAVLEFIFEHAEYVPEYRAVAEVQSRIGGVGFVIPMINRLPFQQLVLDHVGEVPFFYMLYDQPGLVAKMMTLLNQVMLEDLNRLAEFNWPYLQFDDNLDGTVTNPRLFQEHCLPYYQRYTEILHGQGKKVGAHTDGDLKPLLPLLAECGLDICESFSPAPLTSCAFNEAWNAWKQGGPTIWGGIPSTILEESTSDKDFRNYVDDVLKLIGGHPIILGVADLVMPNNSIERVRYIADRVENHSVE